MIKEQFVMREKVSDLLHSQDGKFYTVYFTKVDGTRRKMNGRLGVKKYLKGGVNRVEKWDNPLKTMFECVVLGYRTVNLHTVTKIVAGNIVYTVKD